jgi:outer membrane protein TolC
VDLAFQQNTDMILARLGQQKAKAQARIAGAPFSPQLIAGSGLAFTEGFPSSIEGSAPSIIQAKTVWSLFDRSQSYQVAQANTNVHGAESSLAFRQQEVAYQIAGLFLDAERASRSLAAEQRRVDELTQVQKLVESRFQEGREIQLTVSRAGNDIQHAKRNASLLTDSVNNAEAAIALVLGMSPTDRVQPAEEQGTRFESVASEDSAVEKALNISPELKKLDWDLKAKALEIKGYKAQRLPKVDAVAQYSLLSTFNNIQQYFTRFQRNNVELGASIQIPVLTGRGPKAYISRAETEAAELNAEVRRTRGRIESDIRRAYQEVRSADEGRDLARSDLDLARQQVSLDLDQAAEGRLPQATLENHRAVEDEMWVAFYDAQVASERARLNLLHSTGDLLEAMK